MWRMEHSTQETEKIMLYMHMVWVVFLLFGFFSLQKGTYLSWIYLEKSQEFKVLNSNKTFYKPLTTGSNLQNAKHLNT